MDYRRTLPEFRETIAFLDAHDMGNVSEYQVHPIVGWSNNLDNAVKIAQALNEAEGL
jgi:hypothetical protein